MSEIHEVQLVNYLKATGIEVGLLINFGRSLTVKRRVMDKK
jgi:GxxExxY protein